MSFQVVHYPLGTEVGMCEASKCHRVAKRRRKEAVLAELLGSRARRKALHALQGRGQDASVGQHKVIHVPIMGNRVVYIGTVVDGELCVTVGTAHDRMVWR